MIQYTIRRILYSIPVLIGILVVTFVIARSIPGDPCKAMLGEKATARSVKDSTGNTVWTNPYRFNSGFTRRISSEAILESRSATAGL